MSCVRGSARKRRLAWRGRPADFVRHGRAWRAARAGARGACQGQGRWMGHRANNPRGGCRRVRAVQRTVVGIDGAGGGLGGGGRLGSGNPDTTPCNCLPAGACDRAFDWAGLRGGIEDGARGGTCLGGWPGRGPARDGECGNCERGWEQGCRAFRESRTQPHATVCSAAPATRLAIQVGLRAGVEDGARGGTRLGGWPGRSSARDGECGNGGGGGSGDVGAFRESPTRPHATVCLPAPATRLSTGWCCEQVFGGARVGRATWGFSRKSDGTPCNCLLAGGDHRAFDQMSAVSGC
jgi:hypothetical protein